MRIPRLHVADLTTSMDSIQLSEDRSHYLSRVLRLGPGDKLRVFDGQGSEFEATVQGGGRSATIIQIGRRIEALAESPLAITVAQGLCRGDRMDWVLQKGTELGVQSFQTLTTARSTVRLGGNRLEKRMRHWQAVVVSACEQCGRATVPRVSEPAAVGTYLGELEGQAMYLDPKSPDRVRDLQLSTRSLVLMVGPEGGFTEDERQLMKAQGIRGINLGPRILRTETAGLAVISALQSRFGDC